MLVQGDRGMEAHYPNTIARQAAQRPYAHGGGAAGGGEPSPLVEIQKQTSDGDRSSTGEHLRVAAAMDCNLSSLCDHIQLEGFNGGAFSDMVVHAMGSTYHLHRLILSRSSYFRNMLQGPWKEANAPVLTLHVDDGNVNGEAIRISLAYLYGHHPKLNDNNAFRVLAAASFLDLQDLCAICTDFIISELWTSNFLAYQVFAESQDYGLHGERIRNACWGYLCQSGAMELKEVLPKLSSQTLHALLTSDELWVPSEEKRFELALYALLAKSVICEAENQESRSCSSEVGNVDYSKNSKGTGNILIEDSSNKLDVELGRLSLKNELDGHSTAHNILVELADRVVQSQTEVPSHKEQVQQTACAQSNIDSGYHSSMGRSSSSNSFSYMGVTGSSCSYIEMPIGVRPCGLGGNNMAMEGPSEEDSCYQLNNNSWFPGEERHCGSLNSSCNGAMHSEWGRSTMPPLSWGGRTVGRREVKTWHNGLSGEYYDAFVNIFEGGSLLYSNMSFEALLNVRKQLEEMGFPCRAVNDGLWLQMLLSQRVQEVGVETCRTCCLMSSVCACRQPFGYSRGVSSSGYYMQEHDHTDPSSNIGNVFVTDSVQREGNDMFRPVRVHARGPIDGLAGIGRGTTFVPTATWPPTRFVFSRVPLGVGSRNCQQSIGNDDPESRADHNGDLSGDGLTALVGLSQGGNNAGSIHPEQVQYSADMQSRMAGPSVTGPSSSSIGPSSSGIHMQVLDSSEHPNGMQWESTSNCISLDMKTPLSHFPPFRFAVEFHDVHRLNDSQVKHSPEVFYAGSLWKISVQVFNEEDPQGCKTLGLFLHRRKAELTGPVRKVHMYIDSREKVTARYQLICPSKREVMVFGSFKQTGTLLPKAPKGWGWRTALLFDELRGLLQNGALRVAAVVQLI